MIDVSAGELLLLAATIAAGGVMTGILAGLFGIGGGAVIVPVLYEVFRVLGVDESVRMQLCVGTSLAIIVPTTIRSYLAHRAKGMGMPEVVRQWAAPAVVGVAIGAVIAAVAPGAVLKAAFALISCVIAVKLLFGRASWRLGDELPGRPAMTAYGLVIGLGSSLIGVSGGSMANMIMSLYGKTMHRSVATSAGLGVPIAIAGTIGYMLGGLPQQAMMPPLSLGYVSLIGFVLLAPISSFTAVYGAKLAHALPRRSLEIAFGLFLLAMSVRFTASLIG
jgi:uncharacterized membrane protein YfcA